LRTFAVSLLTKIRELISHPESIDLALAVLAEYFGRFTLEPTIQDGEPVYLAHGKVDFFGEEAMARTGGAGGQARLTARLFLIPGMTHCSGARQCASYSGFGDPEDEKVKSEPQHWCATVPMSMPGGQPRTGLRA
jgi:hypothetical protein